MTCRAHGVAGGASSSFSEADWEIVVKWVDDVVERHAWCILWKLFVCFPLRSALPRKAASSILSKRDFRNSM
jgi:hypothetical protein